MKPLMQHVDILITTEEDTRVVFEIGADAKERYENVDADSYGETARALQKRFGFRAVAITLRENPRVLLNTWSAIVAAEDKIYRAPRYEVRLRRSTHKRASAAAPSVPCTVLNTCSALSFWPAR